MGTSSVNQQQCSIMIAALLVLSVAGTALSARLPLIVNGQDARLGAYPWQVSLQQDVPVPGMPGYVYPMHFCGGAILSSQYILTAAHCIVMGPGGNFNVVVGIHDQTRKQGQPEVIPMLWSIAHQGFGMSGAFLKNDIAIIRLAMPIDLDNNDFASPVELANPGDEFVGDACKLTGWGRLSGEGNNVPNVLQEVDTTAISREQCQDKWNKGGYIIEDSHICFYNAEGGACQGDSGGPAVCKKDGRYVLTGVTSGGDPNCDINQPSIYTRVSAFRQWIAAMMKDLDTLYEDAFIETS